MGAEVIARGAGFFYRFGTQQLNLHGPGLTPTPLARVPVVPGSSDLCFVWDGPIETAAEHLKAFRAWRWNSARWHGLGRRARE